MSEAKKQNEQELNIQKIEAIEKQGTEELVNFIEKLDQEGINQFIKLIESDSENIGKKDLITKVIYDSIKDSLKDILEYDEKGNIKKLKVEKIDEKTTKLLMIYSNLINENVEIEDILEKEFSKKMEEVTGLKKEISKNLTLKEKQIYKEILGEKTLYEASAGDIYSLKQNGFDLTKLFLQIDGKFVKGQNSIKEGDKLIVNFWGNKEIDRIVGTGDILDINEIKSVEINGRRGERRPYPRPGFYSKGYLAVHEGYIISIVKKEHYSKEDFNKSSYERFSKFRGKEFSMWLYSKSNTDEKQVEIPFKSEADKKLLKDYIERNYKEVLELDGNNIKTSKGKKFSEIKDKIGDNLVLKKTKNLSDLLSVPGFEKRLGEVCDNIGVSKTDLLIVIGAESNYKTDNPNPYTRANGLIQFMPETAKGLGTTVEKIANMGAVEQLGLVEDYFKPYKKDIHGVVDLYKAVFFPAALGKPDDWLFKSSSISPALLRKQNWVIAKYSTRPDKFIDGYAFKRYVAAHVASKAISYEDIKNNVSEDITIDKKKKQEINEIITDKNKVVPSLYFKHGHIDLSIIKQNIENIKRTNGVFIFREGKAKIKKHGKYVDNNLSTSEISAITTYIQSRCGSVNIYIDQEGGKINRYRDGNLSRYSNLFVNNSAKTEIEEIISGKDYFPSVASVGQKFSEIKRKEGINKAKDFIKGMALLRLKSLDDNHINTYGMVCDISNGNGVIDKNGRSFASNLSDYKLWADAMLEASKKTGVSLYLKHFPGHGNTGDKIKGNNAGADDSHKGVYSLRNQTDKLKDNIKLFRYILNNGEGNVSVMVGHIVLSKEVKKAFDEILPKAKNILTDATNMEGFKQATGYKSNDGSFFSTDYITTKFKNKLNVVSPETGIR